MNFTTVALVADRGGNFFSRNDSHPQEDCHRLIHRLIHVRTLL
jgi:hypothetical protein